MVIPLLAAKLLFAANLRETSRASAPNSAERQLKHGWQCQMRWCVQCHTHHSCHLVLSAKTAGQAAELKEAFELYESNAVATKQKEQKDGLISEMSLGHVLRSVGQIPTDAQVKEFFVKYSKDGKV